MDIRCPHCNGYLNIREVVSRCTECKELINQKPNKMKATLENFLVKWDGNNPLWKELIEWLNKTSQDNEHVKGSSKNLFYGKKGTKTISLFDIGIADLSITISLEQWKELLKPNKMKNNFKEKDRVFHIHYGWGTIEEIGISGIIVDFDKDFKFNSSMSGLFVELLSFTEYTLQGFTQERPFTPEVGKFYFFYDEYMLKDETLIYAKLSQIINNTTYVTTAGGYFEQISETNPLL